MDKRLDAPEFTGLGDGLLRVTQHLQVTHSLEGSPWPPGSRAAFTRPPPAPPSATLEGAG